jgi:hypothetical protein
VTARDLAAWAADAFARYDLATTHRIVTAVTGPGPLPDYVSARLDPATGTVALPRPAGVVLARGDDLDAVIRLGLLTRNALLVDTPDDARVHDAAARAEKAGAPAGVLQLLDEREAVADAVLDLPPAAPVVVIADEGVPITRAEPDAVVLAHADLERSVRAARSLLRESGGDRIRLYLADPGDALRVAAALPVTRVAISDGEMPPPPPGDLLMWVRIGASALPEEQPWTAPGIAVPPYPRATHDRA